MSEVIEVVSELHVHNIILALASTTSLAFINPHNAALEGDSVIELDILPSLEFVLRL